jgi:hypothetical protein
MILFGVKFILYLVSSIVVILLYKKAVNIAFSDVVFALYRL